MVLELVNADIGMDVYSSNRKYKWKMMNSKGDYAIFLGQTCSKAVRALAAERRNMQKNHIYISYHSCLRRNEEIPNGAKLIFKSLNVVGYLVYDKQDERGMNSVYGIMLTGYYTMGGVRLPMWSFPRVSRRLGLDQCIIPLYIAPFVQILKVVFHVLV